MTHLVTKPAEGDTSSLSSDVSKIKLSTPNASADEDMAKSSHNKQHQDPYVNTAPLSVAAVCSDGIVMISLHHGIDDDCNESDDETDTNSDEDDNVISEKHKWSRVLYDLPISTRGPLRIEPIFNNENHSLSRSTHSRGVVKALPPPMAMLTAGWRTDGMTLASAARELIAEERMLYCPPNLALSHGFASDDVSTNINDQSMLLTGNAVKQNSDTGRVNTSTIPYYGRRVAEGLSYYLAKCVFSEGTRSLSTVGMLAVGSNSAIDGVSSIFLIDATGAYRVRAHAIGANAFMLNEKMGYIDFSNMNCDEGLKALLSLLVESEKRNTNIESTVSKQDKMENTHLTSDPEKSIVATSAYIGSNPALELAILKNGESFMRRVRLESLNA